MAMPGLALTNHRPRLHVECGKQGGGAVALVIVGIVPHFPGFIGSPGWLRFSAWIWLFSSTENTMAFSGGSGTDPRHRAAFRRTAGRSTP